MTEDMDNTQDEMEGKEEPIETPEEQPTPGAADTGSGLDMEVTEDDKLWALLAYVFSPLIPIILLLMEDKKDRPFIKMHNMQALVWGVINVVLSVTLSPFLCGIPSLLLWIAAIYWGWQAYQGQEVTIPVITDLVKNQGWA